MTLSFRPDGGLVGTLRCNSLSGRYQVRPPAIFFRDPIIITTAGCPRNWPSNEAAVEIAEGVLFRDRTPTALLSANGRRLYVYGGEALRFVRTR